jgi:stage II sporulation protein AA (anti-sigma F factor antagonist)
MWVVGGIGAASSSGRGGRAEIVSVSRVDGLTTVWLEGELDLHTASGVRVALQSECAHGSRLVLDVSAVEFVDSSGLNTFVSLHRDTAAAGGTLELVGASASLRRLLEITSLSHLVGTTC